MIAVYVTLGAVALDMADGKTFGERVKQRRLELGLTQRELANKVNRTKGAISHWEQATTIPPAESMHDIARALDTDATWLAFGAGDSGMMATNAIREGGMVAQSARQRVVEVPAGFQAADLQAFVVEGGGLEPRISIGDIVYVPRRPVYSPAECIGHEAIVTLPDGRSLLRKVAVSGYPDCVSLVDGNGIVMQDVKIKAAYPVVSILRPIAADLRQRLLGIRDD